MKINWFMAGYFSQNFFLSILFCIYLGFAKYSNSWNMEFETWFSLSSLLIKRFQFKFVKKHKGLMLIQIYNLSLKYWRPKDHFHNRCKYWHPINQLKNVGTFRTSVGWFGHDTRTKKSYSCRTWRVCIFCLHSLWKLPLFYESCKIVWHFIDNCWKNSNGHRIVQSVKGVGLVKKFGYEVCP